MNEVI